MTSDVIEELRALLAKATPRPWSNLHGRLMGEPEADGYSLIAESPCPNSPPAGARWKQANADFDAIVALRNNADALLSAAARAASAPGEGSLGRRPVAFRVKDFGDNWILFHDEAAANRYHEETGALMQGLYVQDGASPAPVPPTLTIPPLTEDQEAYLRDIVTSSKNYDPNVVVGGPKNPAPVSLAPDAGKTKPHFFDGMKNNAGIKGAHAEAVKALSQFHSPAPDHAGQEPALWRPDIESLAETFHRAFRSIQDLAPPWNGVHEKHRDAVIAGLRAVLAAQFAELARCKEALSKLDDMIFHAPQIITNAGPMRRVIAAALQQDRSHG